MRRDVKRESWKTPSVNEKTMYAAQERFRSIELHCFVFMFIYFFNIPLHFPHHVSSVRARTCSQIYLEYNRIPNKYVFTNKN